MRPAWTRNRSASCTVDVCPRVPPEPEPWVARAGGGDPGGGGPRPGLLRRCPERDGDCRSDPHPLPPLVGLCRSVQNFGTGAPGTYSSVGDVATEGLQGD